MPRFMALLFDTLEDAEADVSPEQWEGVMAAYNEFGAAAGAAGVIGGGEALQPPKTAVGIKLDKKGGTMARTDAPFAEAKEVCGGFYLLDCADIEEAIQWAAQIPAAWMGSRVVVIPCIDFEQ
jgi:hypothetical protein